MSAHLEQHIYCTNEISAYSRPYSTPSAYLEQSIYFKNKTTTKTSSVAVLSATSPRDSEIRPR